MTPTILSYLAGAGFIYFSLGLFFSAIILIITPSLREDMKAWWEWPVVILLLTVLWPYLVYRIYNESPHD